MPVHCICQFCDKPFQVPASQIRKGRGVYCSKACLYASQYISIEDYFLERCKPIRNGCMIWTGPPAANGYGMLDRRSCGEGVILAHRFSWIREHGEIPDDLCVLHDCPAGDNRLCVNVDHLFLGTRNDNAKDMVKKGRQSKGEDHGQSKLTDKKVRKIRRWYKTGDYTLKSLAEWAGVTSAMIGRIVRGMAWTHIK